VSRWNYIIRGYQPLTEELMIETCHVTKTSRDIEIELFRERMKRGEIVFIEVFNMLDRGYRRITTPPRPVTH